MVKNWGKRTPKNFRFTAKFPRVITHDKRLKDIDKELERFFEAFAPPSLQIHEDLEGLSQLVPNLDTRFRYAVEVRHKSWFQDLRTISF